METLKLDYCWICSSGSSLHEHHIIPRCYGGESGPTVTLCAVCHGGVHDLSHYMPIPKVATLSITSDLVPSWNKSHVQKVWYLANTIHVASNATKHSQNRWTKACIQLSPTMKQKLNTLKGILGTTSQDATINRCIDLLHASLTKK